MTELEEIKQQLIDRCKANGYWISADYRVRADTAAKLLNIHTGTLNNWRYQHGGKKIPYYKINGGITYKLEDIAEIIKDGKIITR